MAADQIGTLAIHSNKAAETEIVLSIPLSSQSPKTQAAKPENPSQIKCLGCSTP
jgi:hypothetical protein